MDHERDNSPEPVLLIIADISGYTRYMTANAKTLSHSQIIITELLKTILQQIELPLEVAELEGDAVFIVCRKLNYSPWSETKRLVGDKLVTFFRLFREKIAELSRSTTCTCNACAHIQTLRLKIVIHSGEAIFYRVLNFVKPAGVDVIIVHRLLKNSVAAQEYLLLTEAARHEVEFSEAINLTGGQETYQDIGTINTLVGLPDAELTVAKHPVPSTFANRFRRSWKLFYRLWFAPFASHSNQFRHGVSSATAFGRIGFALLTALLTPLFLPVGTIFVLFHAFKSPANIQQIGPPQEGIDPSVSAPPNQG